MPISMSAGDTREIIESLGSTDDLVGGEGITDSPTHSTSEPKHIPPAAAIDPPKILWFVL
jgi:hypothetical protein